MGHRALEVTGSGVLYRRAQRPDRASRDRTRDGSRDGHELTGGGSRHHPHGRTHADVRVAATAAKEVLQRPPRGDAPLRAASDAKLRAEEVSRGVFAR